MTMQHMTTTASMLQHIRFRTSEPLVCLEGCDCRCHDVSVTPLGPLSLTPYIGNLYVSKKLLRSPWSLAFQCNVQTCRRTRLSQARVEYVFPPWFVSVTAAISTRSSPISLCLSTPRLIANNAEICKYISIGDIEGVKNLLLTRKATIHDVTYEGYTLLHVCLLMLCIIITTLIFLT